MKTTHTLLALAIGTCLAAAAHAEPAASNTPDGASTLDAVQVQGKRGNAKSGNQNVTVVGAAQLEDELAENMEDLVRYIPGVSVSDMGRFGDNGFNIRGMEGDRVSMVVDGLSLAEGLETARDYEFFRGGRGGVDVDTLKQVEIIKGADAITAGSGALGGGVVFTTRDPSNYLKASGNDSFGSIKLGYTGYNDEKLGSFTVANRSGIVESMLVYTRRESQEADGWYDSTAVAVGSARRLPDPIDHDSTNILAKVDFVLSPAHRLGVVYERNRVENLVNNLSRVASPGYLERWGDDSNDRDRYGLRYVWSADNAAFDTMEAQVDRQETASYGLTRILAGSGCPGGATPCQRTEDRSTEQVLDRAAVDFAKAFNRDGVSHSLLYGAAWQQREVDFSAIDTRWRVDGSVASVTVDPGQIPKTDVAAWNLYVRDRIGFIEDRLQLTLGARYDRYDYSPKNDARFVDDTGSIGDVSFSSPTWQVGLSYAFLPEHSVWVQAGRGFRAPTTGEMYAPTSTTTIVDPVTGGSVLVPTTAANPDLESEKSLNLEAGYRWETETVRLGLSVFRDRYDDFIDTVRVTDALASGTTYAYTTVRNVGEVTVKGAEAEVLWRIGGAWLLRGAYSHNEGEEQDGTPLNSINPDRGVVGLSWQGLGDRLRITGNLTHALAKKRGDVHIERNVFGQLTPPFLSDAYTVVDLFGSYRFNEHLRVNAGVYNLFDEKYYQWARIRNVSRGDFYLYGYATDDGIGRYSEPGRNVRATLTWTF
ncbi:TonB-dependent hemoglobin/transferrin/lactoferrin family receptor [Xanthomonas sp. XNM01]|uniref:TonB-dependent hemoglobin/transferrin/lactoferrin family receptor n=1 Tax=Xanthomonas sp. XNM01 TaxID=2769289 RepID=UPI00177B3FC2|nr:TonB-dependent hemoglobin/transferrin/lactoferrin family receptor [Xanthomonas sp. XNM01]MBD9369596.1 TonB-dependent hemoglobin/transferrin/lactoferrin family receptor [Xanthomonas sp. XNM01]